MIEVNWGVGASKGAHYSLTTLSLLLYFPGNVYNSLEREAPPLCNLFRRNEGNEATEITLSKMPDPKPNLVKSEAQAL